MIKTLFINNPAPEPPPFKAFIAGLNTELFVPNGSFTTPFFTGSASGGTAPYTYAWTVDKGSVSQPAAIKTRCTFSGSNREIDAALTLTVTDDEGNTTTATILIFVQFGIAR